MPSVEIVAMVYKSPEYANFITDQLVEFGHAAGWDVRRRVVANDPEIGTRELLEAPRTAGLDVDVYLDPKPSDYYLNRVYRCWNWCVKTSPAEWVCLVNSDMAFSDGWLDALLRECDWSDWKPIPTSRLVESGKMRSGAHAISQNFGRSPKEFRAAEWQQFAQENREPVLKNGGLFMPVVFNREWFLRRGGYPEGNRYRDGFGTRNGRVLESGDACFFNAPGMTHVTVFDSLAYHIQEGEMDS